MTLHPKVRETQRNKYAENIRVAILPDVIYYQCLRLLQDTSLRQPIKAILKEICANQHRKALVCLLQ